MADKLDRHWTPQYWLAKPCDANFTIVGKFEHMEEDISGAIKLLGLSTASLHKNASKKDKNDTLVVWYNQVSTENKMALKELYKLDFEIFGFTDAIP